MHVASLYPLACLIVPISLPSHRHHTDTDTITRVPVILINLIYEVGLMSSQVTFSPYFPSQFSTTYQSTRFAPHPHNMGGNTPTVIDGVGVLTIQRALDIARNTEGDLDPAVADYLEARLAEVWGRIQAQPDDYILTKDEFAIFNYYIRRFEDSLIAERAVARFWRSHQEGPNEVRA